MYALGDCECKHGGGRLHATSPASVLPCDSSRVQAADLMLYVYGAPARPAF